MHKNRKDIDYFSEYELNRTNLARFYYELPKHLQKMFKLCNNTDILDVNVLQGYQGPSRFINGKSGDSHSLEPSNGVQVIKFWFGFSKTFNFIPITGTIAWFAARTAQAAQKQLKWSTLYFDTKTGECLSHTQNDAAEQLNKKGLEFFNNRQYDEAAEYFNNAYMYCTNDYSNENIFKQNRNKSNAEVEALNLKEQGDRNFDSRNYEEARKNYQAAFNKSTVASNESRYQELRNRATNELEAISLKNQGDISMNSKNYKKAQDCYQAAYDKSTVASNESRYQELRNKATNELEAMNLKNQGQREFNADNYFRAQKYFEKALNKSENISAKMEYQADLQRTTHELKALNLKFEGDRYFSSGDYENALEYYQKAFMTTKLSANKTKYQVEIDQARAELDALKLKLCGDCEFTAGNYETAKGYYETAFDRSKVASNKTEYYKYLNQAKSETEAYHLKSLGDNDYNSGRFQDAQDKYLQAFMKSSIDQQKTKYIGLKNKAEGFVAWEEAWDAEKNENEVEATKKFNLVKEKFDQASNFNPDNLEYMTFNQMIKLKLEGNKLYNEGIEMQENSTTLMLQANEMRQQELYDLASEKNNQAIDILKRAKEIFQLGSQYDRRFSLSIPSIDEQIEEAEKSTRLINNMSNKHLSTLNLNVENSMQSNQNSEDDKSQATNSNLHYLVE